VLANVLEHHAATHGFSLVTTHTIREAIAILSRSGDPGSRFEHILVDVRGTDDETEREIAAINAASVGIRPTIILCRTARQRHQVPGATNIAGCRKLRIPVREVSLLRALAGETTGSSPSHLPVEVIGASEGTPNETGLTVLVAEDNVVNRRLIGIQLRKLGHVVDFAENGVEATTAAERKRYDLVLMDCQMPEMDGYEATRKLRSDRRFAELWVVAMTANALQGDRERCLAAGMSDYLSKPIRDRDLREAIQRFHSRVPQASR
jgi:CheY-like chemotaxis protein